MAWQQWRVPRGHPAHAEGGRTTECMLRKLFGWATPARPTLPATERPLVARSPVVDVTDDDFDTTLGAAPGLVLVDFWAEWCQPCDVMSGLVDQIAQEYADRLLVAAVDVDENPQTAQRFDVMGLPTLLFLHAGAEVGRHVGLLSYEELRAQVEARHHALRTTHAQTTHRRTTE